MAARKWADNIRKLKEAGVEVPKCCPFMSGVPCNEEKCAIWNHIDEECSIATLGTLATIDIGGRKR